MCAPKSRVAVKASEKPGPQLPKEWGKDILWCEGVKYTKTTSHFSTLELSFPVLEGGRERIPDELSPVAEKGMGDCSSTWQISL